MSMFKGKEVVTMPKEITVPRPGGIVRQGDGEPVPYAPDARETDIDAEGSFLNAHRRLKAELAEARRLCNEATIELKVRDQIIAKLKVDLIDCEQAKVDCAAFEQLFQNIAAMTDSFLKPREIQREHVSIDQEMMKKVKEIIEEKHDERGD